MKNSYSQPQNGTVKISGGDQDLRTSTLIRDSPDRGEEQEKLRGESEGTSSTSRQDSSWYDGEAKDDFWSISRDFIYRYHVEPRVKLYVPTEESFSMPLKYIDVTRTDTTLDVMSEENIEDYWNVDGDRELSDEWTGCTRFTVLNEKPLDGCTWSGRGLTRKNKRPEGPTNYGQKCGNLCLMHQKMKRRTSGLSRNQSSIMPGDLSGIYFIDPEDEEFKLTMKSARRKLDILMPAAMPCKTPVNCRGETCRAIGEHKAKYACIAEDDESMRIRMEGVLHRHHEDHVAGKGIKSLSHYNLVHKFVPMPQAMKVPDAKAAVENYWGKMEKIPAWQLTKVRNKKEVIEEARNKGRKVQFASLTDLCHLKKSELEPTFQKYKRQSCAQR